MTVRSTPSSWARERWLGAALQDAADRIWYPRAPPGSSLNTASVDLTYARKITPRRNPKSSSSVACGDPAACCVSSRPLVTPQIVGDARRNLILLTDVLELCHIDDR